MSDAFEPHAPTNVGTAESAPPTRMPDVAAPDCAPTLVHINERTAAGQKSNWPSVPGYEILGKLGQGGMGVVYKARQLGLNRTVALKVILHGGRASGEQHARFLREAEMLAKLRHESVVQIIEIGEWRESASSPVLPFFSMEYVEGGSLDRYLRGAPLPGREAAVLLERLARAVQAAHEQGIIHRDLKPGNVLMASGASNGPGDSEPGPSLAPLATPKITDFGLAKDLEDWSLSVSGDILGTPQYMAPEQASGKLRQIDARTDVYALGAILYECLTGRPPFRAASHAETLLQVLYDEPAPVRALQPSIQADLATICHKCLHKEPERRYQTARELAEDLARFQRGEPVLARPVGTVERGWRWSRRNPVTAGLLAGIALLLVTVAVVSAVLGQIALRNAAEEHQQRLRAETSEGEALLAQANARREAAAKETARQQADTEEKHAKRLLYASQLSIVQHFWDEGAILSAREKLDDLHDHRDTWEYRYLFSLLNQHGQRTFFGHARPVLVVGFSPDGKRLVSGSEDQTVKVWDAATGREVYTLKGHRGRVVLATFSPDGKRVLTVSEDRTLKVSDAHTGRELLTLKATAPDSRDLVFSPDGKRVAAPEVRSANVWNVLSLDTGQVLYSLKGHRFAVRSLAFSPDGKRIATASEDATVKVWDADSAREILTFNGHLDSVLSVAFTPDGRRIASGSSDGTLKVWDADSGQERFTVRGHRQRVEGLVFSPDGKRLISKSERNVVNVRDAGAGHHLLSLVAFSGFLRNMAISPDGKRLALPGEENQVHVWDIAAGQRVLTLKGHTSSVASVAFSPDGKRLLSGSYDTSMKLWDADNGQEHLALTRNRVPLASVVFSPDGKQLVLGVDSTVKVWDAATGRDCLTLTGHTKKVSCLDFSPDGKRIASGSEGPTVRVWDARSGVECLRLAGHLGRITSVVFSPDSKWIASGSEDHTVRVWDAQSGQSLLVLRGHTGPIDQVLVSPDGKRIASGSSDRTVKVWDAAGGKELFVLGSPTEVAGLRVFSPDGRRIATTDWGETLKVWDAYSGRELITFKGYRRSIYDVVFSPDGKRLVTTSADPVVRIWDAASGQELLSLQGHRKEILKVTFSPDGQRIATASGDETVKVWDAHSGQELLTLRGLGRSIRAMRFSPDGQQIAAASAETGLKVWDAPAARRSLALKGHTDEVRSVVFSPDGKRIASGSQDGSVRVWNAVNGQHLILKGHSSSITGVVFSPDGKRIISGSWDREVKVWDAQSGRELLALKGHLNEVVSVAISPDGTRIASVGNDRVVKVWDASSGQELLSLKGYMMTCTSMGFSADGRRVTACYQEGKQMTWDLATGKGSEGEEELPIRLSPRSPDGRFLAVAEGKRIRVVRLPAGGAGEPEEGRWCTDPGYARHVALAEESWEAGEPFAAAFHFGRLLERDSSDAGLHVRRAHALVRAGQPAEAAVHFVRAALLEPRINCWPLDAQAARRGQRAAEAGDWPLAAADLELAARQPRATLSDWSDLLLARRLVEPRAARESCRVMLDRFETAPRDAQRLIAACLAVPCEEPDARRLFLMAGRLIPGDRTPTAISHLGAALYRAGRFEEASTTLATAVAVHPLGGYPDTRVFLAMAQQKLGKGEEARQALERFENWLKGRKFSRWQEAVRWRVLHEEARALILAMPRTGE